MKRATPGWARIEPFPASFHMQTVQTNGTSLYVRVGGQADDLRFVASNVSGGIVPSSGHWIMEENRGRPSGSPRSFLGDKFVQGCSFSRRASTATNRAIRFARVSALFAVCTRHSTA